MLEIFIFIFGCVVGYIYCIKTMASSLAQVLRNIQQRSASLNTPMEIEPVALTYQSIDEVDYFYLSDSNTFVCQGKTFAEAAAAFHKVSNGGAAIVVMKETGAHFLFKDGVAKMIAANE